ncbi:MAG: ATP synthase F1 subunit epsilon [Lachnospiraceae bacterium]|jgi:F-type H+-transporting ATPase subunit epsilon|nr:ATP synthase F1 subunit epsilon [Lachnospiraceae bacterium]
MAEKPFKVKIVSPERLFFQGDAEKVEFNTTEGEIGIYARHIPMTVLIAPGLLTLYTEEGEKKAALHSGFAEILPSTVTVLAEVVEWADEIDADRAQAAVERARERIRKAAEETDLDRAEIALHRALARLKTIKK